MAIVNYDGEVFAGKEEGNDNVGTDITQSTSNEDFLNNQLCSGLTLSHKLKEGPNARGSSRNTPSGRNRRTLRDGLLTCDAGGYN